MSLKYEDFTDMLFVKHRWRAVRHVFKLAAMSRYAIATSPTSNHVLRTEWHVIPPAVNCQCPQPTLVSSSSIPGAFGFACSMRSTNWTVVEGGSDLLYDGEVLIFSKTLRRSSACWTGALAKVVSKTSNSVKLVST